MPGRFLTDAECARLSRFPDEITPDDLNTYFTLSPSDRQHIQLHHRPATRLGVALQLCALRYLGFSPSPANLKAAPIDAIHYLSQQLAVTHDTLASYGQRAQTCTEQWQLIQQYLGYRGAARPDLEMLATWLIERAQEHDKPTVLFQLAADKLHTDKIVRPGVTVLERIVARARDRAYKETLHRLQPLLTAERGEREECRAWLVNLLVPDGSLGRTRFDWLKRMTSASSIAIFACSWVRRRINASVSSL